jgi:hypothetical protein
MNKTAALVVGIALCAMAGAARAESTAEAMKTFGLVGTWSLDCAGGFRIAYSIPSIGQPTITGRIRNYETDGEIIEATRLTAEKLRVISVVKKAPAVSVQQTGETWEAIYLKQGSKFRALLSRQMNGTKISAMDGIVYKAEKKNSVPTGRWLPTGQETGLFEKCSN